ncbi:hypothetical protein DFP73DRAFT_524302 [Morchella snyderi]|nr:hypothetical protein DFP73DRAFT_524302 [Morchella snyderi]
MTSWGQVAEEAGSPIVVPAEDVPWEDQENLYGAWEDQVDSYDPWEPQEDPYEMSDDPEYPYETWGHEDTYSNTDVASPAPSYSHGMLSARLQSPDPTVRPAEIGVLNEAIALLQLSMSSDTKQEEDEREQLVELALGVLKRERERRRDGRREREPDNCVVCCAERADTVCMPCRHLVMCGDRGGGNDWGEFGASLNCVFVTGYIAVMRG